MAAQAAADVLALEIEKVRKKVPILFEREDTFFSSIEKRDVNVVSSRDMVVPLEIRPGGKFRHYSPAGGDLGRGGGPNYQKATVSTEDISFAVEWNSDVEWSTNDQRKAVLSVFKRNIAKGMAEFRRHIDSLSMTKGDGVVGTITSVATGGSTDTYTWTTDGFGVRLLRFGQDVNVYAAGLGTRRTTGDGTAIDLIDLENNQVRLAANVGSSAATDKIVVSGLSATPPTSLLGVPYHHDSASTGTWLSMNRANFPEIRANRVTANASLALPFARLAVNKIGDRLGMKVRGEECVAWMHPCQVQAYEELGQLVQNIRKSTKDEGLNLFFGGAGGMQMAGCPVREHFAWDKTRIDFIKKNNWGRAEMRPAGFYGEEHGKKLFEARSTDGGVAAAWLYYLVASFNFFVDNPAGCSYISDLSVPSGY